MEAPGGPYDKQEGETGRSPEPGTTAYPRGKSPWVCHGLDPTVEPSPEATDSGTAEESGGGVPEGDPTSVPDGARQGPSGSSAVGPP